MPITITPIGVGTNIGPGVGVHVQTDFIGPLPSTATWQLTIYQSDGETPVHGLARTDNFNPVVLVPWDLNHAQTEIPYVSGVQAGAPVRVVVNLLPAPDSGPAIDTGARDLTWEPTSQLMPQIAARSAAGKGLSDQQAQQVQQTWEATHPAISVDSTIPFGAGVAGPGGVISNNMPAPFFGLIVRIFSFPPEVQFSTPDQSYSVQGLAVVNFFRGSDIWMRVPVHTVSKLIPIFGDTITAAVATALLATWLFDMSYQVHFREGVTGEVIEMRFP